MYIYIYIDINRWNKSSQTSSRSPGTYLKTCILRDGAKNKDQHHNRCAEICLVSVFVFRHYNCKMLWLLTTLTIQPAPSPPFGSGGGQGN